MSTDCMTGKAILVTGAASGIGKATATLLAAEGARVMKCSNLVWRAAHARATTSRMKSTVEQIRERFDHDVERFSNLETGQSAQIDSPLALELVTLAASATTPHASAVLDVGCGAGNFTLKLLQRLPHLDVTLIDLSRPMLDRALQRVSAATSGQVTGLQGDIRELPLGESRFDIIVAASVLHHLRNENEWQTVFGKFHAALRPKGSVWIHDFIEHTHPQVQALMWERYGAYLTQLKDAAFRDHVFAYVEQEDSPRSLLFQIDMLRSVGFKEVDVLHKNNCFAAFGATKGAVDSRDTSAPSPSLS